MKKIKVQLLFVLLTLAAPLVYGQAGATNDLDKIYTPANSQVFGGNNKGSTSASSFDRPQNAITFSPFLAMRGIAALTYERSLSELFSVSASAGFSFSRDYFSNVLYGSMFSQMNSNSSVISLSEIIYGGTITPGSNLYFAASGRIYFDSNYSLYSWLFDWDKSYLEVGFRYANCAYQLPTNVFSVLTPQDVSVVNTNFNIIMGQYYSSSGKIKTTHDIYYGFSFRTTSFDAFKYSNVEVVDQYNNTSTISVPTKTGLRESNLAPMLLVGYTFGIGW
jgi:hypothetical protein